MSPRKTILLVAPTLAAQDRPRVFRITPVRPVAELRVKTLDVHLPKKHDDFLRSDLVDLV